MNSPEFLALASKDKPINERPGDMWICRRLGIITVKTAHKRGSKRTPGLTEISLYHWGKPALHARPAAWRDFDPQCGGFKPESDNKDIWEYVGNIFDLLPYHLIDKEAQ